jgi:poly(3-hydroxybutyrate) depolymerase
VSKSSIFNSLRGSLAATLVVFTAFAGSASADLPPRVNRVWKSADGREMKADLLEYSADEVKIKRSKDFEIVKVPLTALSAEDQAYVKDLVRTRDLDASLKSGPYAANITGAFVKVVSKEGLNYQIYGNPKWDGKKRYPLFVSLHGSGQSGTDNQAQMGGPTGIFTNAEHQAANPCFMVVPQCPDSAIGWNREVADHLMTLIDDLSEKLPIDTSRLYLTGFSMGGFGCFSLAAKYPTKFAAVIPVSGGGDAKKADILSQTPIWAFHGDKDEMVNVERTRDVMKAIMAKQGSTGKYDELAGQGHNIPGLVYNRADLTEWMFAQKRVAAAPAAAAAVKKD